VSTSPFARFAIASHHVPARTSFAGTPRLRRGLRISKPTVPPTLGSACGPGLPPAPKLRTVRGHYNFSVAGCDYELRTPLRESPDV
jgi:hypothetical protein